MGNLHQDLLDPYGICSVCNSYRDGNPQFLIRFGVINDDIRGYLVIWDGDDLVIKGPDPGMRVPTDTTSP